MLAVELDHVNEHQFHQVRAGGEGVHQAARGGSRQGGGVFSLRVLQREQQGGIGIVCFEDSTEKRFLVGEVVI